MICILIHCLYLSFPNQIKYTSKHSTNPYITYCTATSNTFPCTANRNTIKMIDFNGHFLAFQPNQSNHIITAGKRNAMTCFIVYLNKNRMLSL